MLCIHYRDEISNSSMYFKKNKVIIFVDDHDFAVAIMNC